MAQGNNIEYLCLDMFDFVFLVQQLLNPLTSPILFLSQNGESMLNGNGLPIKEYPNHWKGENGLYCAGLARRGLAGIAADAKNIANDIKSVIGAMSG